MFVFPTFAGMKRICWIGLLAMLAVAACNHSVKVPEPVVPEQGRRVEGPSPELCAVDSLMWRQPDSALMRLLPYFNDSCCGDAKFCVSTTTEYNRHYAHLLLAELLYKNYCEQTNRTELLQAVTYFDSLVRQVSPPFKGARGIKNKNSTFSTHAFLDARAHYINGVGYYEQGDVAAACAEYLKASEVMEERFEEKELVGCKALFIALTYNRLGDAFSEQFMMDPAITCYERALLYCKIEPTSPQGVSNILYRIGKQYDKMDEIDKARQYYAYAIEEMPSSDNLSYRDLASLIAFNDYQLGIKMEQTLIALKQVLDDADDDYERLTRYLTIGVVFFEEGVYDSAMCYFKPVFDNKDDESSQIQAANYLRIIYDSLEEREKADECMRFLADHKKTGGEDKALVSKLDDMFKNYMSRMQEKQAEKEREAAVRNILRTILPLTLAVSLAILIWAKLRGRKLLKQQRAEADKVLEETGRRHEEKVRRMQQETEKALEKEKKARQREKEKLQQGLQQRDEQLSALEKALTQQREKTELRREAFMKEAICSKINDSIRNLHITAREGTRKNVMLTDEDAAALRAAVLSHYENFEAVLLSKNPKMSKDDLQLCQLYLLGLDERQIAVLQCKSYSAIKKRANTLKDLLGIDENLPAYIKNFSTF